MSTSFRKIALVGGSGHLGPHILRALQANPTISVTVISRHSSSAKFSPSATVVRVSDDYPKSELVSAFKGHDAVILSLNFQAEQHHETMVDASIDAGVKRLVPSVFGGRHTKEVQGVFPFAKSKADILSCVEKRAAKHEDWSYTAVSNGLFHELCVGTGFYGIDAKAKTATIWDEGTTKFSASTYDAIAQTVVQILSKPVETKNTTVYISSFETTLNELLDIYQKVVGDEGWTITRKESEEGIREAQETSRTAQEFMPRMMAIGRLALLSSVKGGLGADFVEEGLSWNEKLGVQREDVNVVTRRVLKQ